jgi:uncharacterized protein YlxW (UPF0749 family)
VEMNGTKINKLFLIRVFLLAFLVLQPLVSAQSQTRKVKKAERRQEQLERKEKREYEKRRKAVLKQRYDIQTREVQDRMKATRRRSEQYNKGEKEPFYKNLFNRKKKKRKRRR